MTLNMVIRSIKCISNLELNLPLEKGLYAITGENGSGKSTIITCASSAFFSMKIVDYFGKTEPDSKFESFGAMQVYV